MVAEYSLLTCHIVIPLVKLKIISSQTDNNGFHFQDNKMQPN